MLADDRPTFTEAGARSMLPRRARRLQLATRMPRRTIRRWAPLTITKPTRCSLGRRTFEGRTSSSSSSSSTYHLAHDGRKGRRTCHCGVATDPSLCPYAVAPFFYCNLPCARCPAARTPRRFILLAPLLIVTTRSTAALGGLSQPFRRRAPRSRPAFCRLHMAEYSRHS